MCSALLNCGDDRTFQNSKTFYGIVKIYERASSPCLIKNQIGATKKVIGKPDCIYCSGNTIICGVEDDWVRLEVWKYDPGLFATNGFVDDLSLLLSFKEAQDERIGIEIERLLGELLCED